MTPLLGLLADDLTGALDATVAFPRAGLPTRVTFGVGAPDFRGGAVLGVDTATRSRPPAEAAGRAAEWAARLRSAGAPRLYKKLDSTLRGPWAEELEAVLASWGATRVLLCPAFPARGRVVRGGRVQVVGAGPRCDLATELGRRTRLRITPDPTGEGVWAPDAETDAELNACLERFEAAGPPGLLAGSAGLAAALARRLGGAAEPPEPPRPAARRVVVAVGSLSPAAREQARMLGRSPGVRRVSLAEPAAVPGAGIVLLATPPGGPEARETPAAAAALAEVAAALHRAEPFDGWVLTGGETATAVLAALGVTALRPVWELAPGVPAALLEDGGEGWVVTKAGSFGESDCLLRAAAWLRGVPGARVPFGRARADGS